MWTISIANYEQIVPERLQGAKRGLHHIRESLLPYEHGPGRLQWAKGFGWRARVHPWTLWLSNVLPILSSSMPATRNRKQATVTSPTKSRAPRRCRVCDGRPLLSECDHRRHGTTKKSSAHKGGNALSPSIMVTPATVQVPLAPLVAALPSGTPSDTAAHPTPQLGLAQSVAVLSAVPEPAVQVTSMGPSLHVVGTGGDGRDDAVLPPMPAPTQAKEKKHVYPSDVNPVFGTMTRVGRGSSVYQMARKHRLKDPYANRKDAVRAFESGSRNVITRAESVAERTGAWVYVAMQHPRSRTPFIHYASRKLRAEAPEELQVIHRDMNRAMTLLKQADRAHHLDLIRARDLAEEQLKDAIRENEHLKGQLASRNTVIPFVGSA
ncbi:hypothetical protein FA13DRAFT_1797538 [Coprinellus micaceus]|uniref:Uncharacterized protein n=1 Tax=Coprinellus micaceus TaxID=71717 RepID=A0A4Y7SER3_COPMI|nr:hypothetical protein FA13DRAFT_1802148 [Coprinellus micaceus]TEB24168.1 hypothetical protein FA13DRAFT_1797538 [Coprinellus micaceus]